MKSNSRRHSRHVSGAHPLHLLPENNADQVNSHLTSHVTSHFSNLTHLTSHTARIAARSRSLSRLRIDVCQHWHFHLSSRYFYLPGHIFLCFGCKPVSVSFFVCVRVIDTLRYLPRIPHHTASHHVKPHPHHVPTHAQAGPTAACSCRVPSQELMCLRHVSLCIPYCFSLSRFMVCFQVLLLFVFVISIMSGTSSVSVQDDCNCFAAAGLCSSPSHFTTHTFHLTRHTSPHTSHLTPHTSHLSPHTSHLTPHTSHLTPHTSHPTPHTS